MRPHFMTATIIATLAVYLTGCASTPAEYRTNRSQMSDATLCRTALKALDTGWGTELEDDIAHELLRRGLNGPKCKTTIQAQNADIAKGVVATVAIVAIAAAAGAAASKSSGGSSRSYATVDSQWRWDRMANGWRCRGLQTGQYASNSHCAGLPKVDYWP